MSVSGESNLACIRQPVLGLLHNKQHCVCSEKFYNARDSIEYSVRPDAEVCVERPSVYDM